MVIFVQLELVGVGNEIRDRQVLANVIATIGVVLLGVIPVAERERVIENKLLAIHGIEHEWKARHGHKPYRSIAIIENLVANVEGNRELGTVLKIDSLRALFLLLDDDVARTAKEIYARLEHVTLRLCLAIRRDLQNPAIGDLIVGHFDIEAIDTHVYPRLQRFRSRVLDNQAYESWNAILGFLEPSFVGSVPWAYPPHGGADLL